MTTKCQEKDIPIYQFLETFSNMVGKKRKGE